MPDLEGNLGQNEVEPTVPVESDRADGGCTIGALSVRLGSSGPGVACLQQALVDLGYYEGAATGHFDDPTLAAVMQYQADENLFVDGVVGRETAIALGVWPDEEIARRAHAAAARRRDGLDGLPAVVGRRRVGDDAPPLPADSGSGRRVVYDRAGQRVWAVDDDDQIIRSWLVSGSKYSNEQPGHPQVYSRSEQSTAWNGKACLPLMIRYQKTDIGAHRLPRASRSTSSDGTPYQTEAELGTRLSGGCQRQAQPRRRIHVGVRRRRHHRRRHLTNSPPCLRCNSIGASQQKCNANQGCELWDQRRAWRRTGLLGGLARISAASTRAGTPLRSAGSPAMSTSIGAYTRRVGDVPRIHRRVRPR